MGERGVRNAEVRGSIPLTELAPAHAIGRLALGGTLMPAITTASAQDVVRFAELMTEIRRSARNCKGTWSLHPQLVAKEFPYAIGYQHALRYQSWRTDQVFCPLTFVAWVVHDAACSLDMPERFMASHVLGFTPPFTSQLIRAIDGFAEADAHLRRAFLDATGEQEPSMCLQPIMS